MVSIILTFKSSDLKFFYILCCVLQTAETGCGYDDNFIWSSSECGDERHWVVEGENGVGDGKECRDKDDGDNGIKARCCADPNFETPLCCLPRK